MSENVAQTAAQTAAQSAAQAVTSRDPMRAAMLKLAASRAKIHSAVKPEPRRSFAQARQSHGAEGWDPAAWIAAARDHVAQWGVPTGPFDSAIAFCREHPALGDPGLVWAEAERSVGPVIRRHPVMSVAVAAAAGALVYVTRPWEWVAGGAQAAGSHLTRWVGAQLSNPVVQSAVATFLMSHFVGGNNRPAAPGPVGMPPSARP